MRDKDQLWQCPLCSGELIPINTEFWNCQHCNSFYPLTFDIPDFRPAERRTALERRKENIRVKSLLSHFEQSSFEELVDLYSNMISERPGVLGELDRQLRLSAAQRGKVKMNQLKSYLSSCSTDALINGCVLEVGCGVGDMIPLLSEHATLVIAIDVSMDLLVLAKKVVNTYSLKNVVLVCVGAETLPFVSGFFDLVYASHVIEHLSDQSESVREFYRVLRPGGGLYFDSPNRFSISYEPHVQLLGVGYLPRFLMNPYVRLIRGIPYTDKQLLSFFELRRLMKRHPWQVAIHSHETSYNPESRSLKNRIYRKFNRFIPKLLKKYVIAESFLVFARK